MHGLLLQKTHRWFTLLLVGALLAALAACGGDGGGGSSSHGSGGGGGETPCNPTPPSESPSSGLEMPIPACFSGGGTAQIDMSAPVLNWTWNDPHVLKVGSEYWMYASATDNFDFPVRLYRLVSPDGVTWTLNPTTPILPDAPPGRWDSGGWETPAVVFFGGKFHLFYTGYPIPVGEFGHAPLDYRVGHATSCDGVHFTRVGTTPTVLPSGEDDGDPTTDWYAWITAEPGPVVYDGQIYLYFTTFGVDEILEPPAGLQVIGLTKSSDGITWSTPQRALRPDQTQFPIAEFWVGYSTPNAIELDGQVHLFYDVAQNLTGSDWKQIRLHHSYSPNGENGWVPDGTSMYSISDVDWATEEVRSSDAFLDGTTLRFYFAGHNASSNLAIGQSTCSLAPPRWMAA